MASHIDITPGNGDQKLATYQISEDAVDKQLGRQVPSNSTGTEIGTFANPIRFDPTGSTAQPVTNDELLSIDAKVPALGQALSAASVPVVLPAAQITTLTPPAAITGFATSAKQDTIIGHVDGIEGSLGTLVTDSATSVSTLADILDQLVNATSLPAGTNNIGDVDIASIAAGNNNIGDVDVASIAAGTNTIGAVNVKPATAGGTSTFHLASAGTTNATVVKNSAGQLFGWYIYNSNAAARKVVFHNASSTPTAGASVHSSLMIPATSAANVELTNGIEFSTGIAITTVTGLADSDSAAVAANDLIINLYYK